MQPLPARTYQRGRYLGGRQGAEHRLLGVGLEGAALRRMAELAWRFEPHGLSDSRYRRQVFERGYEEGYRAATRAGLSLPAAIAPS